MGKTLGYGEITVANVTEPFTVMLTNEAQQFATDSNRKVTSAQSYYTDIIVIRGSQERTDYTIGNITSGSGITVSKNSKRVTFSVSAGTTIGADAGVIEIPITLDGQTVKKQFSWSCGKQGPQGVKGQDGNSFAWNMLSETNCGKKHWGTESSGGKYSVEDFITEDNIDAVKLICTEAISTSNWSYVSFKDIKMLKQLKPSTKYTLSYDIKANRSGAISHSICKGDVSNFCTNTVVVNNIIGNETWQHISVVLTTNDLKTTPTNEILYLGRNALSKVGYSIIKNLKLVEGDIDTPWSPSQSDIEGKGVVETVQYYLATSQASGVTSSTSGWSTDITTQKLTADKKYLWNCYQTKYSDGTSEPISTPKVIGVYGDKGQNAKNLSITPSSQYFKSTDGGKTFAPNTITIKPTIQGEISFGKWQYSIDGGVSFADIVSGQKGLTINNNVLTVSKDSSLYSDGVTMVTFRAVANDSSFYDTCSIAKIYDVSDIGDGRNLLTGVSSYTKDTPFEKTDSRADGWTMYQNIITSIELEAGKKYVLQAKTDGNWAANHDTNGQDPSKKLVTLWLCSDKTNNCFDMRQGYAVFTPTVTAKYKLRVNQYSNGTDAYTIHLWDIKLEKGSSPTGWTPAPEDLQTAILSTKSEISDVSLKVDNNKQAIEQRVEKTTYQQDLNLVKGDISKANEGLNKWRYEIYPKSLFASEYQGKSTMDVFAKNTNLTPSQSVLINDTDLSIVWNYAENYIGYALTFTKFSAAKSVAITFAHDDGAHIYLNGKLIGGSDAYSQTGESLTLGFVKGWNCIEVVVNDKSSYEGFTLGTTISTISECQLMNCYYGTPVARQSHITNQLVQNTTDIKGISTKVSKVTSVIGDNGENFTSFKNEYSDFKQTMNVFKTTVGQTYVTKDDFNGLEIGGRNLVRLGGLSGNGATSFSYDKTTDTYTIVSPVVSTVWGTGAAVKYDDNHKVLIPYGKTYILSFEVKVPQALSINIDINNYAVSGSSWAGNDNDDGSTRGQSSYSIPANTWTKVWVRWANTNTKNTNKVDLYDNSSIGLVTKDCTSAVTWQIRHVKGELGNKPTDWTPAPEDVNGKIVNVETIANQTAKKFEWIVKGGDSSSNFTLTDRVADLVAERINFKGLVTFSGLNTDAKNEIGKVAQSKVDNLDIGGRNLLRNSGKFLLSGTTTGADYSTGTWRFAGSSTMTKSHVEISDPPKSCQGVTGAFQAVGSHPTTSPDGECIGMDGFPYFDEEIGSDVVFSGWARVVGGGDNCYFGFSSYMITFSDGKLLNDYNCIKLNTDGSWTRIVIHGKTTKKVDNIYCGFLTGTESVTVQACGLKLEKGNKATDWTPAPEDVSQDATNKASQALTDAKNYSSNAVNWVTNNGSSTTSLNSMVKKWTDGAVSDTTQINGGWIKANTITASKIAVGDFTNYADINESNTYGFSVEKTTDGVWFSKDGSKLTRDNYISKMYSCEPGQTFYVEYDISNTIKDSTEYKAAGIMLFGCDGTQTVKWYQRRGAVVGTDAGTVTHMSQQLTMPSGTRFFYVVLQIEGFQPFTGTLKIRNLSVRKAVTGAVIVDGSITADKIATDAIKSRNYISSGGTQGSFLNLKDGSFTSPNLSWDANGNLIAKNANLSGEITATNGSIAGWTIISNKMYTTGSGKYTGIGKYGSAYAFWAGATSNDNGNSAVFKVGHTGKLTATDADITGTITATNGKIGRYDITSTYLMTNSGSNASGIGGNQAFWAGAEDSNSAPFRVGYDGVLWAENAAIRGSIETGNLGDEGDTVSIINGHIGIQGTSNNVEIYSTGFKFGIDGDYYLMSVSEGVKCYRNLYATDFVADGWLYCSEVHSSGAVVIGADSESFYWAHGYQIARGTSWGGVCVGDDSQQLRLYGSSIWASHSISTSDENLKENFTTLDQYENFYMNLNPIGFNYIGDYDGKKTHFGFGAHKTEDVLESEGYDADKFAVVTHRPLVQEDIEKRFGKDVEVDIETEYGVSYTEFIALNTHMIQKTRRELTKVKQEKADLEVRLQAIEVKLGL